MVNGIKAFKHISHLKNTGMALSIMSLNSFNSKRDAGPIFCITFFPVSRRCRTIDFEINYSDSVVNLVVKGCGAQSTGWNRKSMNQVALLITKV